MNGCSFVTLRERPELKDAAAEWFHAKWRVPKAAYLECMDAYLGGETEYGWYLCFWTWRWRICAAGASPLSIS